MKNYNKINLYKENIIKFIKTQNQILILDKISDIDYLIGILFLTEMNRYCKTNKISIHGYYIAYSLINLFIKIKKKLLKKEKISYKDLNHFWLSLSNNIDYLNSRVDETNVFKTKINNNYCKLIIELIPFLNNLVEYSQTHKNTHVDLDNDNLKSICSNKSDKSDKLDKLDKSNKSNKSNKSDSSESNNSNNSNCINCINCINCTNHSNQLENIYCNQKCYICWVDKVLSNFFYILLITAKFIGSGDTKDPNLFKLSEYYSNIIYIYLKIQDLGKQIDSNIGFNFFNHYIDYKNKLNYSIIELKINSDTLEEIINYLDDFIVKKLSIK
jgi:hypothetical protein